MPPRQIYQNQKYCAHNGSDSEIVHEERTNKEYRERVGRIKKAYQLRGRTFVILSQDIVDKLSINENTWFRQDLTDNGIILTIIDENGGVS